ncbi:hypothetical protein AAFF_G00074650 [Aldrovandia affinis]|uniref:Fibronectin type-III domain-containing protein n=1 Tax=Aldrovandia affinis TaxID=143900 RepID=A0AAD7RYL1_9TELE|nr:hypothetical protein AAFF_G00074650 [Aldrovandia affinis]
MRKFANFYIGDTAVWHTDSYSRKTVYCILRSWSCCPVGFNLSSDQVFVCKCETRDKILWFCGFDLHVVYPPREPRGLLCIQEEGSRDVRCWWKEGRENYRTTSELWVRTQAPNSTEKVRPISGSSGSATFSIQESQAHYSVWVNVSNKLGFVVSRSLNFSLRDIVRPPAPKINRVNCSSRHCVLYWDGRQDPLHMQVEHRAVQGNWTTHLFNANANRTWGIDVQEPYTSYEVRARCMLTPWRGLWSEWSTVFTTRTEEEAPHKKLDMWYTEESPHSQNASLTVLWKGPSKSEAGGRIMGYRLVVHDLRTGNTTVYNSSNRSTDQQITCAHCNVTLSVYNSKGHSPPVSMTIPLRTAQRAFAPQDVQCTPRNNSSIAICWQEPATAAPVSEYLVEWYPVHRRKQELRWTRMRSGQLHAVITENIRPGECYQGAVYALYEEERGKADFLDVFSMELAPTQGPTPTVVVDGRVIVTWTEIPRRHRRGCLRSYTIYLERTRDRAVQKYVLGPVDSRRRYSIISDLQPGERYNLSMTGSTTAGEGYRGESILFFYPHREDQQVANGLAFGVCTFIVCLAVMSLCQISSVRQRLATCCFCFMPVVPDPANSNWAKECAAIKGDVMLDSQLYFDNSTLEEEPHTVEIQELQEPWASGNPAIGRTSPPGVGTADLRPLLQPSQSLRQTSPLYPGKLTSSYIKSFSHESESSEETQESRSTDVTVDYISSHGLLAEGIEVAAEDDDDCPDESNLFSCPLSPFLEPKFSCGGKLTLDAVKIDCSFLDWTQTSSGF